LPTINPLEILLSAFPGIPRGEAEELIAVGRVHSYPADTILCHENALASTFYIILQGKVQVSKIINRDQVRVLKSLKAGDFFGEMALIHNAPRAATVTTSLPTTVLEIQKSSFDRMMRHSASLSLAMAREVSRRLSENDAMAIEDLRMKASELAVAYQRLAEQDISRQEFLTTVARGLQTPLTAANGYIQAFLEGKLQEEAGKTALQRVADNLQQIIALVNDILFLQEVELTEPQFSPTDLTPILLNTVETYRPQAEKKRISLKVNIKPNLPSISGEARLLERAFKAILDNAVKFSPQDGVVCLSATSSGSNVLIEIQDQGVGIEPEMITHIFDPFFHQDKATESIFDGVGLGLSIAQQVVKQHGGEIIVESAPSEGSTFKLSLPSLQ
jgi:signal transduction histidine kinase